MPDKPKFYGWKLVAVLFLLDFINMGFPYYGGSIINSYMIHDIVMSRATLGWGFTILNLFVGFAAIVVAMSIVKYGLRATFMIGSALAALAGVMIASEYGNAHFYMGFIPGLKAFTAAVLGGIGNLGGAMVGGVLLGLIEQLGAGYIGNLTGGVFGSNYQDVFAFIVLIIVLVFRPSGLLGERVADRA